MSVKIEFIQETNKVSNQVVYFTQKDDVYVSDSLSHNREKAYDLFLNIASGLDLKAQKEVLETIYKLA
jgi:hypothetical protein